MSTIHEWQNTANDFASDDYIGVDGETLGSRKMSKDSLLGLTAQNAIKNIVPEFSSANTYAVGNLVTKDGTLYKCTTAHSGNWNSQHFTETTVDESKQTVAHLLSETATDADFTATNSIAMSNASEQKKVPLNLLAKASDVLALRDESSYFAVSNTYSVNCKIKELYIKDTFAGDISQEMTLYFYNNWLNSSNQYVYGIQFKIGDNTYSSIITSESPVTDINVVKTSIADFLVDFSTMESGTNTSIRHVLLNEKVVTSLEFSPSIKASYNTEIVSDITTSIAPEYNGTTGAVAGRLYMNGGVLYRCKENTSGNFNPSKFVEVPASDAFFDKGSQKKSFGGFQVKDIPVLDQNGTQANVNLFEQVVQIPKSKKQWFNKNSAFLADGYIGGGTFTSSSAFKTAIVKLLSGASYRVSITDSANRFTIAAYQDIPSNGDTTTVKNESSVSGSYSRKYMDITLPEGYCYLCIYFYVKTLDGDDYAPLLNTIMVSSLSEGENDFQTFELDRLSLDNVAGDVEKVYPPPYGMLKKLLADSVLNPQNVTDVTSTFNLDYTSGKYLNTHHNEATSSINSISNYIAVDLDNLYFCYLRNTVPNCCGIVYYDAEGLVLEDVHCGSPATDFAFPIVPPAGAAKFRICSEAANSKVYKVINRDLSLMLESKLKAATSGLAISEGDDVTSSYPLNTGVHYRISPNGRLASASIGYVTDVIPITDWSKTLLLRSKIDQYGTCCVFYKDLDGNVIDSVAPIAEGNISVSYRVIFPITAKSFRLGTRTNDDYSVNEFTYIGGGDTQAIESRLSEVESDVAVLENSVAELEESAMLSQVIDTVEAVKYRQKRVLYLGANIFDFASLVYDSNYWSVDNVNGTISYLGGSLDPVELNIALDNNSGYVFECTTSNYVIQTNMFALAIGDIPMSDPYNGTDSIFASMYSDGGKLKIYPISSTNTFTLSSLAVKKKVSQGAAQETVEYNCLEVNNGNGEFGALTAMWNVAIGPTAYTQPVKLSLTRSIAIGYCAQRNLIGGWQDIAIGTFAMNLLKFGNRNIALGCDCLYAVTHADDCIAIGKAAMSGIPSQVNWNDPATWQHILNWVSIGTASSKIANGQSASDSVYIGFNAGSNAVGSQNTVVGSKAKSGYHTNVVVIGYQAQADKNNQTVIGNSNTTETKVYGDLVVRGTDNVLRKIVFNNDNTVTWEVVS